MLVEVMELALVVVHVEHEETVAALEGAVQTEQEEGVHLHRLVQGRGVEENAVKVVRDKVDRQLAEDGVEERVARECVADAEETVSESRVALHELVRNVH